MASTQSIDRSRFATILRDGRIVTLQPPLAQVLSALVSCDVVRTDDGQVRRPRRIVQVERSVRNIWQGVTRAGFLPVVEHLFRQLGYSVEVVGDDATHEVVEIPVTRCLSTLDRAIVEFVASKWQGIVHYAPGHIDVGWLIAQLCLSFPTWRIIAVADNRRKIGRLARRVASMVGTDVPAVDARTVLELEDEPRIAITTPVGLVEVNFEWADVILFLHAGDVTRSRADAAVTKAHKARIFGLLPFESHLSPFEWDLVRSVLGFAEIAIPDHGAIVRPVSVLRCDVYGGPCCEGSDVVKVSRSYVWRDPIRARRVAKLADLIRSGNVEAIHRHVPTIGRCPATLRALGRNVLVVCDNAEHLDNQARVLPHWTRVPDIFETGSANGWPAIPLGFLATRDAIADGQISVSSFNVVIYAGANPYPVVISPHALECDPAHARPLVLIDVHDRRHPLLRTWTRERAERYAALGWFAPGVDPVLARIDRFIGARTTT
jgi:hypothetical protein